MKKNRNLLGSSRICVIIIVTAILFGCEVKVNTTIEQKQGVTFGDSSALTTFKQSIGAESIIGFQEVYKDTIEHVLLKITVNNPAKIEDVSALGEQTDYLNSLTDSIIRCLDYNCHFDSLSVEFLQESSHTIAKSSSKITYFANAEFIQQARERIFPDREQTVAMLDSLLGAEQLNDCRRLIDSLQRHDHDYFMLQEYTVRIMITDTSTSYAQAHKMLTEILQQRPYDGNANFLLGYITSLEQQYEASVTYFNNALRFAPENNFVNYYLAETYLKLKDSSNAMRCFKVVQKSDTAMVNDIIIKLHNRGF